MHFVVGTLAKDTNFQVYLLDGIFRWNADRAAEAVHCDSQAEVVTQTPNQHAVGGAVREAIVPQFQSTRKVYGYVKYTVEK